MKYINPKQLISHRERVLRDADLKGITKTSRMYGLSRNTIYRWKKDIEPRKHGPRSKVSWQTGKEIEEKIIIIRRETNYGPKRIKEELKLIGVIVGEKAIRGVLNRNELTKHHKKKRIKKKQRFYAPYPGYRIQIDTKVVPDKKIDLRSSLARYQFTAIDIATKIRFCLVYDTLSNANTIDFLKKVLLFYQEIDISVECIQTDNHATFTNLYLGGRKKKNHELLRIHPFTKFCMQNNISHILSRPGTPKDNCFVERSHRTDDEEFYRLIPLHKLDNNKLQSAMQKWMYQYNFLRLHSSCDNMPPMKYYLTVTQTGA